MPRLGTDAAGRDAAATAKRPTADGDQLFKLYCSFYEKLPKILEIILDDYVAYLSRLNIDDARHLAAGHLAGRAALLHIQEILRLVERFSAFPRPPREANSEAEVEDLLRQARSAIAATVEDAD